MLDRETEQTFSKSKSNLARFIYKDTHENMCRWNSCDARCQDRGRMLVVRPLGRSDPPLRCLKHPRPRREPVSSACYRQPQIRALGRFPPSWRPLPSVERLILVTFPRSQIRSRLFSATTPPSVVRHTRSFNFHASISMRPQRGAAGRISRSGWECFGISFEFTLAVSNAERAIGPGPGPPKSAQECGYGHGSQVQRSLS